MSSNIHIDGQKVDEMAVATCHEGTDIHGQRPAGMNHFIIIVYFPQV